MYTFHFLSWRLINLTGSYAVIAFRSLVLWLCFDWAMGVFQEQQVRRVEALTARLYEALIFPDGGSYLKRTGSLLKASTLRTNRNKEVFKIISRASKDLEEDGQGDGGKRFWTKALFRQSLEKLFKDHALQLPQLPGFSWRSWLSDQTGLLHSLAKKAFRNRLMDQLATVPFDLQARCVHAKLLVRSKFEGPHG